MGDKYGIDCYLEASKKRYRMYKKKGFMEAVPDSGVSGLHFDVSDFTGGGEGDGDWVDLTCMIRKPQRKYGL
jgi:hypothetical protein